MPLPFVERNFWQVTIFFEGEEKRGRISPKEMETLFQALGRLLPIPFSDQEWDVPSLGGPIQVQLTVQGPALPPLATCTSARGWFFQLLGDRMTLRHQQHVRGLTYNAGADGGTNRLVAPEDFPGTAAFATVALHAIAGLPRAVADSIRRVSVTTQYVGTTGDIHPASWIASHLGRGSEATHPILDDVHLVPAFHHQVFETHAGVREVRNDVIRVGNWFDSAGEFLADSAVVFQTDYMTAVAEKPSRLKEAPSLTAMPALSPAYIEAFFSPGHSSRFARIITSARDSIPKGVALHGTAE